MDLKISYACDYMVKEIKEELEEFGDTETYVFLDVVQGIPFVEDYLPVDYDDEKAQFEEVQEEYKSFGKCKMSEALMLLETQNDIFCTRNIYLKEFAKVFPEMKDMFYKMDLN